MDSGRVDVVGVLSVQSHPDEAEGAYEDVGFSLRVGGRGLSAEYGHGLTYLDELVLADATLILSVSKVDFNVAQLRLEVQG